MFDSTVTMGDALRALGLFGGMITGLVLAARWIWSRIESKFDALEMKFEGDKEKGTGLRGLEAKMDQIHDASDLRVNELHKENRQSIHDLGDKYHGAIMQMATMQQWRDSHEVRCDERHDGHHKSIDALTKTSSQALDIASKAFEGAIKALDAVTRVSTISTSRRRNKEST